CTRSSASPSSSSRDAERPLTVPSMSEAEARAEHQGRLRADGALMILTVLWGTTFVVVKDALGHGDPFSFLALRFGVGAGVLSVLAGRQLFLPINLRRGAVLGVFLFLGFALQTVGLTDT